MLHNTTNYNNYMKKDCMINGMRMTVNSCLREDELKTICSLYIESGAEKEDVISGLKEIKGDTNLNSENRKMIDNVIVMIQ